MSDQAALDAALSRRWFYEFDLPDGRRTECYLPEGVAQIHTTRLQMLMGALAPVVAGNWAANTVVDVACHQGYFASHLARMGCPVLGVDVRPEHVADTELIARAYGLPNLRAIEGDVNTLQDGDLGQFDITLMLGLLYHVENPVGAIRLARALTRKACVIETQIVPNMTGVVDWGSYRFQRPLVGAFGIIDETAETHAPEASTTGFCITPSFEALVFLMYKLGFARVERVLVPEGGYEQLASGKRVMVIGYVDGAPPPPHPARTAQHGASGAATSAPRVSAAAAHASPTAVAAAAPLAFSGERYIPDQGWANIAYEHVSRYLFAQPLCAGKHVLDVGSGEGYGAHLLCGSAASVVGVDLSPEAVAHAAARYAAQAPNLRYVEGSATKLPVDSHSVDVVVSFEMLEHIAEHEAMIGEIRRVLKPSGLLLVSTPNKVAYSDIPNYRNPFHVRELYFDEFRALIDGHFGASRFFAQKNVVGSVIAPLDETQAQALHVRRIRRKDDGSEFEPTAPEPVDHLYFIAACSDSAATLSALAGVVVADRDERRLEESDTGPSRSPAAAAYSYDQAVVMHALRSAAELAGALAMERRQMIEGAGDAPPEHNVYDLIVPVFNVPDIVKACLDSLIANTDPRHLIHVIDDASTDPRIDPLLQSYAARYRHIRHYRLNANLGFPGTVNAAIASTTHDVVLVNSDTVYPPHWLARMDRCRRSSPAIHAVSPLSNNATICSVPAMNERNALPSDMTVADMDRLVRQTSPRRYPRVPTVVGFCMLMTRRAIDEIGAFDMVFGRGYGEEVDWCQRAWTRGYESVICDDLYVYHHGEVGFSQLADRRVLQQANERRVAERWPAYGRAVQGYCALNPLRFQQQQIYEALRHKSAATTRVLHVTHSFDALAGTELFTRQLVDGMRDEVASTVLFPGELSPYQDGAVEEEGRGLLQGGILKVRMNATLFTTDHALRGVTLSLRAPAVERFFADVLAGSGIDVVQFNHLANLGSFALPLVAKAMGVKVVIVLHDYFLLCPDWNLLHVDGEPCGEPRAAADNPKCIDCLARRVQSRPGLAAPGMTAFLAERTALARAALEHADVVIAPSRFVRDQFMRGFGRELGERIRVVPHGTVPYPFQPDYQPREALRVAFLGYANTHKGADTFVEAARLMRNSNVRFRIVGGMLPGTAITATDNLELKGPYVQRELSRLLQDVDVVVIGSIVAETYCYTVDESFRAGTPVIATAVGAIPERVVDGQTGILIPPADTAALVAAIERLDGDRALLATMRRNVAALRLKAVQETVAEYTRLYVELAAQRPASDAIRATMTAPAPYAIGVQVSFDEFRKAMGIDLALPLTPANPRPEPGPARKTKRR